MEIVTLGEHLRANENVQCAVGESAQCFLILALGARGVAVQTRDASFGNFLTQAFFELFGTFTEEINVFRITPVTIFGNRLHRAAIMALEAIAVLVMGHGNAAVSALTGRATAAAGNAPGITAAIDQDESRG